MTTNSPTSRPRRFLQECSGACGDLGTFIPHVIGAITVAGLAPAGVLFGFAVFLIGTGLFYGLPMPVQPMKAVSAVTLSVGRLDYVLLPATAIFAALTAYPIVCRRRPQRLSN